MLFYDFEVYRQDWLVVINNTDAKTSIEFINDPDGLKAFYEKHKSDIWVGYNSRHYDQYMLKAVLCGFNLYDVSHAIIQEKQGGWQYSNLFNKIQLYNFDCMTDKSKSLKQLEGFLGSAILEAKIPFDLDRKLTEEELRSVLSYCRHDVEQTMEVFLHRMEEFESQLGLIKAFQLPLSYLSKTKAQLSAVILDAHQVDRGDEFQIRLPDTLRIEKYQSIVDWYKDPQHYDYEQSYVTEVAGVTHTFAWGGLHGAKANYIGNGVFLNIDVASYYPALMIEYDFSSRSIADTKKFRKIRDTRLQLKAEKNPMQGPYKIVLNSTYGAMKDKYNPLYDPLQANNVCVAGQLLLLDLIEQLEPFCELIQSNTDGLIIKINQKEHVDIIAELCREWQARTRMKLEFEVFVRMIQKDVNNYVMVHANGSYKSKGAYTKKLERLDYDLPIVNRAVVDYFVKDISVEETILNCHKLIEFQRIVKISEKYSKAVHMGKELDEKVIRVFASKSNEDGPINKLKLGANPEKIAGTPVRCFIDNSDVREKRIPRTLDKDWYIELARKRVEEFLGKEVMGKEFAGKELIFHT